MTPRQTLLRSTPKDSLETLLDRYCVSGSACLGAAAALLATSTAHAATDDIIRFPTTGTLGSVTTSGQFVDVQTGVFAAADDGGFELKFTNTGGPSAVVGVSLNKVQLETAGGFVKFFNEGDSVGPGDVFQSSEQTLAALNNSSSSSFPFNAITRGKTPGETVDGYIGFTFNPDGNTPLYGWVRLAVGGNGLATTVEALAYDPTGDPIKIDPTAGGPPTTPDPSIKVLVTPKPTVAGKPSKIEPDGMAKIQLKRKNAADKPERKVTYKVSGTANPGTDYDPSELGAGYDPEKMKGSISFSAAQPKSEMIMITNLRQDSDKKKPTLRFTFDLGGGKTLVQTFKLKTK